MWNISFLASIISCKEIINLISDNIKIRIGIVKSKLLTAASSRQSGLWAIGVDVQLA